MLFAFRHEPHLLIGSGSDIVVQSDSKPLVDLFTYGTPINDPATATVRPRLVAALQGYACTWQHVDAANNRWNDAVSRANWAPTTVSALSTDGVDEGDDSSDESLPEPEPEPAAPPPPTPDLAPASPTESPAPPASRAPEAAATESETPPSAAGEPQGEQGGTLVSE